MGCWVTSLAGGISGRGACPAGRAAAAAGRVSSWPGMMQGEPGPQPKETIRACTRKRNGSVSSSRRDRRWKATSRSTALWMPNHTEPSRLQRNSAPTDWDESDGTGKVPGPGSRGSDRHRSEIGAIPRSRRFAQSLAQSGARGGTGAPTPTMNPKTAKRSEVQQEKPKAQAVRRKGR